MRILTQRIEFERPPGIGQGTAVKTIDGIQLRELEQAVQRIVEQRGSL